VRWLVKLVWNTILTREPRLLLKKQKIGIAVIDGISKSIPNGVLLYVEVKYKYWAASVDGSRSRVGDEQKQKILGYSTYHELEWEQELE